MSSEKLEDHFLDIDVTNTQEIISTILQLIITSVLVYKILSNIESIYQWKKNNKDVDHTKLLYINLLLLLCVIAKLTSIYYGLFGCIFSKFWLPICNLEEIRIIYFRPSIYITSQMAQVQILNFTFLLCSNYWLQVLILKAQVEQKDEILWKHNLAYYLIFIFRIALPIVFVIEILMNMQIIQSEINYGRYILAVSTFICCISFIIFCSIIQKQLEDFYIISEIYKQQIKYLFYAMIVLILLRVIYNGGMNLVDMEQYLSDLKSGTNCNGKSIIPDVGVSWSIFSLFYVLFTDILPILFIKILFAPKLPNKGSLLQVEDNWEVESVG